MTEMTKEDKLKHYENRELKNFIQYDFFTNVQEDDVMKPDEDGDDCWVTVTQELMTGLPAVRLLIVPGTSEKDVVRGLLKVLHYINRDGLQTEERMKGYVDRVRDLNEQEGERNDDLHD